MITPDAVRDVLVAWDPLGVAKYGSSDEYDSYIPQIVLLLATNPDEPILTRALEQLSVTAMMMDIPTERHASAARRLLNLSE
jgi:hypothetical protein